VKHSKFNQEGYYDPTAYQALVNIEEENRIARFRPLIYVCSPYAGDKRQNTTNARRYCRHVVKSGGIPLAPHLLFPQFMDDSVVEERELALFMNIALLSKCAELWVFGDHVSKGMAVEIRKAEEKEKTIRYFTADCEEKK